MKRSLVAPTAGAAAILMALAAGCGSSSGGSASGGSSSGASSSGGSGSGKTYKLSFIQGVAGDGFYVTMGCGMQAEAKKLGNATVNIQGPTKFDPTLQNPIIQSVTAAPPDAILIADVLHHIPVSARASFLVACQLDPSKWNVAPVQEIANRVSRG